MFSFGKRDAARPLGSGRFRTAASLASTIPNRLRSGKHRACSTLQGQPFPRYCYTKFLRDRVNTRYCRLPMLGACLIVGVSVGLAAQQSPPPTPPAELVRATVKNEVAAANSNAAKHMFCSRKKTPRGSQIHLYVETNDAMAGMLIATNGQPLNAQQQQGEINHLNWLMGSPEQLRKKRAREKEDAERTLRIVKALPDAFQYEYAGTEDGTVDLGKAGTQLARLKFTPNPSYSPPSHVEQVLMGMRGYLLIDTSALRIARIDGTLFRDVSFGWGIIGHLDKGGHFRVQQADVGDGSWEVTQMNLNMSGKILLFKGISIVSDETISDFRRVPETLTFPQGVKLLEEERDKLARNHEPAPSNP